MATDEPIDGMANRLECGTTRRPVEPQGRRHQRHAHVVINYLFFAWMIAVYYTQRESNEAPFAMAVMVSLLLLAPTIVLLAAGC